jgi:hypothetical protein
MKHIDTKTKVARKTNPNRNRVPTAIQNPKLEVRASQTVFHNFVFSSPNLSKNKTQANVNNVYPAATGTSFELNPECPRNGWIHKVAATDQSPIKLFRVTSEVIDPTATAAMMPKRAVAI